MSNSQDIKAQLEKLESREKKINSYLLKLENRLVNKGQIEPRTLEKDFKEVYGFTYNTYELTRRSQLRDLSYRYDILSRGLDKIDYEKTKLNCASVVSSIIPSD